MNFFTSAWVSGELSEEEYDSVVAEYWAHIKGIAPGLSDPIRELATNVNLHDGIIRRVRVERSAARLAIDLRCGDLQVGYFDLDLLYAGIDMGSIDLSALKELAEGAETEALYDEIDRDLGGTYVHRILFSIGHEPGGGPYREIEVRFRTFQLGLIPRTDREIEKTDRWLLAE